MPPLLLAALITIGLVREYQAHQAINARIAALSAEQRPSLVSTRYHYAGLRSDTDVDQEEWIRLEIAAGEIEDRIDTFADNSIASLGDSSVQRDHVVVVKHIFDDAAPILRRIKELISQDEKRFAGESIAVLLQHQFKTAVYLDEADEALAALRLIHQLAERTTPQSQLRTNLVNSLSNFIRQSLAIGFWQTPAQLESLQSLVADQPTLATDWETFLEDHRHQMAAHLELLEKAPNRFFGYGPFGMPAEAKLDWLEQIDALPENAEFGSLQHYEDAAQWDRRQFGLDELTLVGIPYADYRAYELRWNVHRPLYRIRAVASARYQRLITLTLIAAKRYQLEHGRWPSRLSDLDEFGLDQELPPFVAKHLRFELDKLTGQTVLQRPRDVDELVR